MITLVVYEGERRYDYILYVMKVRGGMRTLVVYEHVN